jgi:hypothetical protein
MATITGATETAYNGTYRITSTGSTTFTYTVLGSPTTPATGTILLKPNLQFVFIDSSSDGYLNIVAEGNPGVLNPGSTTLAHIITNRANGHLLFDLYGNDSRDSLSIRTNSGGGGALDTVLATFNAGNKVGILQTNPTYTLDVTGDGRFTSDLTVQGGDIIGATTMNLLKEATTLSIGAATGITTITNNIKAGLKVSYANVLTFTVDDTTPSVGSGNVFLVPASSSSNITALDDGVQGQVVLLIGGGASAAVVDGSALKIAGNWTAAADATLTLIYNGTNWYELSRSAN